jgi:hypothetical protein
MGFFSASSSAKNGEFCPIFGMFSQKTGPENRRIPRGSGEIAEFSSEADLAVRFVLGRNRI